MEGGLELLDTYTDTLRGDWGDGAYRVRVRKDGRQLEQWDLQIELSPSEKVALRRKNAALENPGREPSTALTTTDGGGMREIAQALGDAMKYQADTMREVLVSLRPAAAPGGVDEFQKMMTAFQTFQNMMPKAAAIAAGDPAAMFEKGLAFAQKIMDGRDDGAGEPTTLLSVLKETLANPEIGAALKAFAQGMARAANQPPMRRNVRRIGPGELRPAQPPRPHAAAPAPAAAPGQSAEDRAMEYLITQAKLGSQPELASNTALQLIPKDKLELLDTMQPAEAFEFLKIAYPAVADHRDWFLALIGAMYADEADPNATAPGENPEHEEFDTPPA